MIGSLLLNNFVLISEKLYSQAQQQAGANAGADANANAQGPNVDENGHVYDADYKVEDEGNE